MTITPEEAAKLAAAATEGPLTQVEQLRLHIECDLSPPCLDSLLDEIDAMEAAAPDMADLIERQAKVIEAAEALEKAADAVTAFVGYQAHVPELKNALNVALTAYRDARNTEEKAND